MRIDSHHHFWDLEAVDYDWILPEYGPIYRNFTPDDLVPDIRMAGIDATVLVQAANSLDETNAMLARADETGFVKGIVAWLPLTDETELLASLEHYGEHELLKGVRHLNHNEPDPNWLVRSDVLNCLAIIADHDLVFEVVAVHPLHLPDVPTIARQRPDLTIVIDHLGKPPIASGDLSTWSDSLRAASRAENVFAKVSGLNTAANWDTWSAAELVDPIGVAIDAFGPERLMFGSDWPVALLAGSYQKVWTETLTALERLGLDDSELQAILGDTAARVYELGS